MPPTTAILCKLWIARYFNVQAVTACCHASIAVTHLACWTEMLLCLK